MGDDLDTLRCFNKFDKFIFLQDMSEIGDFVLSF